MTQLGVELSGVDQLAGAISSVVQAMLSPELAAQAAKLVETSSGPFVPVDTDALQRSAQTTGHQLVYAVPYSVFVQASQPWLAQGISRAVPELVQLYGREATDAWQQ